MVLSALLVVLVLGALGSYIYNQARQEIKQKEAAASATGGDPERGPLLIARYGCNGCHIIPGVDNATGQVGSELAGIARRVYVAGVIPNTPDNLVGFIVDPQSVDEKTAMPRTGITPDEARDVTAYLYSIRQ
jgi:cytochrome c2